MAKPTGSRAVRWRVVRVPAALADRLEALAAELMAAHVEGRSALPSEYVEHVPLHHAIDRALTEFEGHRERSKRPATRKPSPDPIDPTLAAGVEGR